VLRKKKKKKFRTLFGGCSEGSVMRDEMHIQFTTLRDALFEHAVEMIQYMEQVLVACTIVQYWPGVCGA
jgi:hypothetical protein